MSNPGVGVIPPAADVSIPQTISVPLLFNTFPSTPSGRVVKVLAADAYMILPFVIEVIVEDFETIPLFSRAVMRDALFVISFTAPDKAPVVTIPDIVDPSP